MRLLKGNKIIPVFPCGMLKKIKHEKGDIGSMKIVLDVSGEEKESLLGFLDAKKIPYTASFPMACQFFTMEDARSAITDEIAKRGENYQKVADYYDEDSIAKKILAILQGRVQDGFGFDTDALQQVTGEVLYACHNSISELLAYRKRIEGLPVSEAEQKEIEGFILYQGYPGLFRIRPFVMRVYEDVARSLIPSLAACLQQVTENKTFSPSAVLHDSFFHTRSDLHRLLLVETEKHPERDHAAAAFSYFAPQAGPKEAREAYIQFDHFLKTGIGLTENHAMQQAESFVPALFAAALPLFSFPRHTLHIFHLRDVLLPAFRTYAGTDASFARTFAKNQLFAIRKES